MCENVVLIASTIGELYMQHTKYLKPAFLDTFTYTSVGDKTGFPRLGQLLLWMDCLEQCN